VPKIHKIEHTVEGIFDVVSSIILNTDHSLRVLKILLIFFGRHCVAAMSNKDAVNWNSMYSFLEVFFGFTVTSPITLSFGVGKGTFSY
jgi:sorbitol-specific phosphotransferase system component IIC